MSTALILIRIIVYFAVGFLYTAELRRTGVIESWAGSAAITFCVLVWPLVAFARTCSHIVEFLVRQMDKATRKS